MYINTSQARRIINFLNSLEKEEYQEADENQEKYSLEYYPANGLFPGINDNFVVGFDTNEAGSIKREGYDSIELRIINCPDLIEIYEKHGEETALEVLNNLTLLFLRKKSKYYERHNYYNNLYHRGINNILNSGFSPSLF